ncbi:MAG: hypothetical protein ACTSW7_01375 [Candidatus Thorarchaeota archaeon]|nr:hypothetical protein [Thermoplasmatales archaeon]
MAKKSIPLKEQRRMFESNLMFLHAVLFNKFADREYVIGIDPSLVDTAVAVSKIGRKHGYVYADSPEDCRDQTKKLNVFHRIDLTREYLLKLLLKYRSRLVCIEGYAYGKQTNRELMGEVGGMIRLNCFYDHPNLVGAVIVVGPTQLKKYILGSAQVAGGQKTKQLIMLNVYKRLGIEVTNDNQADAIILAKIAKDMVNFVLLFGERNFNGEKDIRDFINKGWENTQFPKYRWEVLCSLIINKCDRRRLFDFRRAE